MEIKMDKTERKILMRRAASTFWLGPIVYFSGILLNPRETPKENKMDSMEGDNLIRRAANYKIHIFSF
jgi:hypothetical protein